LNLVEEHVIIVEPNIAATSLAEASDAVISMPFSTPSLIAKVKGIFSVYYDTSGPGRVRNPESHGHTVIEKQGGVERVVESLFINHTNVIHD